VTVTDDPNDSYAESLRRKVIAAIFNPRFIEPQKCSSERNGALVSTSGILASWYVKCYDKGIILTTISRYCMLMADSIISTDMGYL